MAMVAEDEGLRISAHEGGAGRRQVTRTMFGATVASLQRDEGDLGPGRGDGGKNPDITGTIMGLSSLTAPGLASAKGLGRTDRRRASADLEYGAIPAPVTMSLVHETTYVSRVGISQAF